MTKDTPNGGWNASSQLFDQTIEKRWLERVQPPISHPLIKYHENSTNKHWEANKRWGYCALWLLPITYSCYLMIVARQH
jgi:hypothetical protein